MRRIAVLACSLALGLGTGCFSPPEEPGWMEAELEAPTDHIMWRAMLESIEKEGFPLGTGLNPGELRVVSGWNNEPAPFRRQGFREKAELKCERGDGRYLLDIRVLREMNDDIIRPLDLSYAKWVPDGINEDRAHRIVAYMRSFLGEQIETTSAPELLRY